MYRANRDATTIVVSGAAGVAGGIWIYRSIDLYLYPSNCYLYLYLSIYLSMYHANGNATTVVVSGAAGVAGGI